MSELGIVALRPSVARLGDTAREDASDIDDLVHDLRGPLSVIVAFAESIEGAQREERARFVERLVANAHRALAVLEEFAALSDLRSGEVETYVRPMDLAEVARQAAESMRDTGRRGVDIACVLPQDGVPMLGDRDLLGMALRAAFRAVTQGLVAPGSMRVHVVADGDFGALALRVSDARMIRVGVLGGTFPEFEILERVVSLHGGRLVVEPEDRESAFRMILPRQPPILGGE